METPGDRRPKGKHTQAVYARRHFWKTKTFRYLTLLVVLGFGFRMSLIGYRFAVAFDEVNYLKLGVSAYLHGLGEALHTYWSPLLPVCISLFCAFFGNYEVAGRMVTVVAGALLAVPVYLLGRYAYDQRTGWLAAIFVTLFPPLAFQSTQILTEPLQMLLGAFLIYSGLLVLEKGRAVFSVAAGILAGLLYLNHPTGFGFFLVFGFWLLVGSATRLFPLKFGRGIVLAVAYGIAFLLVASPYLLYLKQETGVWTLSTKAAANQQFEAYEDDGGNVDPFRALDAANQSVAFDRIYHLGNFVDAEDGQASRIASVNLKKLAVKYFTNVYDMLKEALPSFLTTVPMLFIGVGLLGHGWSTPEGRRTLYLLSFIVFYFFLLIPAFHIIERYLTPMWPIFALWVARGVKEVYAWLGAYEPLQSIPLKLRVAPRTVAGILVAAVFLGLSFLPELGRVVARDEFSRAYWAAPVEQKIAGLWLKENFPGKKVLMSRYQTVDIYAGNYNIKESITIPDNSLDRVLAYARHRGVDFLVLNERYKEDTPGIAHLFESEATPEGLACVYRQRDPSGYLTLMYRIK